MEQPANYRKYVILQEKDPGFGVQRPPEGFARLDVSGDGITLSLQIKNLREGTEPYTVILVYGKNEEWGIIRVGSVEIASQCVLFNRKLDYDAITQINMKPESILYVVIAAEHQGRTHVPMVGVCNKAYPWNESIRQRLRKEKPHCAATGISVETKTNTGFMKAGSPAFKENPSQGSNNISKDILTPNQSDITEGIFNPTQSDTKRDIPTQTSNQPGPVCQNQALADKKTGSDQFSDAIRGFFSEFINSEKKPAEALPGLERTQDAKTPNQPDIVEKQPVEKPRVDDVRLERKLRDSFEVMEPFSNPRRDYAWYRVNDLARLSNLLFACNMRIPLFANPKILVGLFKYRHLLAGFYRSEQNNLKYFVLGVPSKDDSEGRPFENISRWVEIQNPDYGNLSGYWLVYINLQSGEFVQSWI
ncbi:MAG: hypothetical protein KBA53_03470 [Thermoclostridium sp.]|nr:hypothetical protein [Thermoclostridium sp.]